MNLFPDKNWTLFLDRDGVLNRRLEGDYVKRKEDFEWQEGVLESLAWLSGVFGTIVVVTNQQGIGKGLMTEKELEQIHHKMLNDLKQAGGRIDKVYFCPDLENSGSFNRKPMVGMGLQARRDFPEINFRQSVMVGDTLSDMRFGKRLKMKTVLISEDLTMARQHHFLIDLRFSSLKDFSKWAEQKLKK
ncbi:MAG: HAD-IIIA family hydrolase [Bacteroides sp.]|jgi:histidinol-phosphate phosphatase family protein|nr:HAD-IIIA family hydrolase [Bacteroides sp.]